MEDNAHSESPKEAEEKSPDPAAQAELSNAALDEIAGGQRSYRFDTGSALKPIKKRQSGILTPRED